ncbi:acylneuraminate cytidylyltransferase family protein [Acetivibrio saccincola]|uniref:acylneuraminate cytidylyltransferase family protein n=1 Tax=Acetivibrio saccincola TaxID=1677857 RepID=UPI001A9A6C98|nr:acylneuraminate cytidylyltransferase family protein [Acetivibrio saccincola]
MGKKVKRLCTICARSGSKGLENKNTRLLLGKPLIAYSIESALNSGLFDKIAVSSDCEKILETAKGWKADCLIKRPIELSEDTSPKIPAIVHCLLEVERMEGYTFDIIVDLDVTSPLRHVSDIKNVVEILEKSSISNVVSGTYPNCSPYFNMVEMDEKGELKLCKTIKKPIQRRQDAPICYQLNASVYAWKREFLLKGGSTLLNKDTFLYVMPRERSVDIDDELDFLFVEFLLSKRELLNK